MRCNRCVIQSKDDPVGFDSEGVCSFCRSYDGVAAAAKARRDSGELDRVVAEIKALGKGREHDCVIGLSGGVDSSYLAYVAVERGLRPLAVHLDNGWDSELAISNIHEVVSRLGLELHTHVVDWSEFRELQLAYIRSGVIDIEVVSDHAINSIAYRTALDEGIKFILAGNNIATEYVMPPSWNYRKQDLRNLKAIVKRHGGPRITTFPTASTLRFAWWQMARGVRAVHLLDCLEFEQSEALEVLQGLGWRPYPGKHYESLFTQFYQAHILPTKFGVDKREAHLASLICSGQMNRSQALAELTKPLYEPDELRQHTTYVLKKLSLSEDEFAAIMAEPPRLHTEYPHDGWYAFYLMKIMRLALTPVATFRSRRRSRAVGALASHSSEARPSALR